MKYLNLATGIYCYLFSFIAYEEKDIGALIFSIGAGTAYLELYFIKNDKDNRRN